MTREQMLVNIIAVLLGVLVLLIISDVLHAPLWAGLGFTMLFVLDIMILGKP